jgi:hypothetical protein
MPKPGKLWRHVIINTRGSWLHGDERGFRNRGHQIHSSGDYKHKPPVEEHVGLYGYQIGKSPPEVRIAKSLRPVLGGELAHYFTQCDHRVLVVAVTKVHAHALVELPNSIVKIRAIVGEAKRAASRAVKRQMPGSIWARGGTFKPVKTLAHQRRAFGYILVEQGRGAWTWSFRDGTDEGKFGRVRK